jgi:hypothetical protein
MATRFILTAIVDEDHEDSGSEDGAPAVASSSPVLLELAPTDPHLEIPVFLPQHGHQGLYYSVHRVAFPSARGCRPTSKFGPPYPSPRLAIASQRENRRPMAQISRSRRPSVDNGTTSQSATPDSKDQQALEGPSHARLIPWNIPEDVRYRHRNDARDTMTNSERLRLPFSPRKCLFTPRLRPQSVNGSLPHHSKLDHMETTNRATKVLGPMRSSARHSWEEKIPASRQGRRESRQDRD